MIFKIIMLAAALLICGAMIFIYLKKKASLKTMLIGIGSALLIAVLSIVAFTAFFETNISINGKSQMTVNVFDAYNEESFNARTGTKSLNDKVVTSGAVDTSKVGEYKLEYYLKYSGREYKVERTVNVVDKTAPVLTLSGEAKVRASRLDLYKESGVTANDNYDGDITANVKSEFNKISDSLYEIVYTATDSSGNVATTKRELEIKDTVKPIISLKGDGSLYVVNGRNYVEAGYTASDDADGDITKNVKVTGQVDTAVNGTYTLTYTVSDSSGNTATATRKIIVCSESDIIFNKICLTFDDGPSSDVTVQILDTLKANDVKATFFIVNYSAEKLPIIKRMIDEGHAIGIHGYSHDYAKIYASDEAFMENINKLRDKLYNDTGYYTCLMRFPGGGSNTISRNYSEGIMSRLTKRVGEEGWRYFDWNVASGDAASKPATATQIYNNVKGGLAKGRSNIVLMHDTSAKKSTAQALQSIIDYGKQNGYYFCAIDDTVPENHHGVNN